ncbi:hypothetical protein MNBD_GAMMA18-735 [hydrothermal vent metagenome]|uniref:Uncharacterized protein n=1 Tax=hydrothermal vent metagenome TaxID=652676 RepID=A0A3B0YV72_9ZZZZ
MQTKHLQPGMALHSDVHDTNGRLLAKADTVLTEKHIKVLKTWGITQADIKYNATKNEPQPAETAPPSDATIQQAETIANDLFSLANREHPAMQQLFNISVLHIANRLGTEQK